MKTEILDQAKDTLIERGGTYDNKEQESERSMPQIVACFNAATGLNLTEAQGLVFMKCLKMVRFCNSGYTHRDSTLDDICYTVLLDNTIQDSKPDKVKIDEAAVDVPKELYPIVNVANSTELTAMVTLGNKLVPAARASFYRDLVQNFKNPF